jgi:hypothetical protein
MVKQKWGLISRLWLRLLYGKDWRLYVDKDYAIDDRKQQRKKYREGKGIYR